MKNKDKNIFHPPARMMIPKSMHDKNYYCVHHEDFGQLTNDYMNLYGRSCLQLRKEDYCNM